MFLSSFLQKVSLTSLVAHYCQSLSPFPWHKATRNIATPPGWDASPSQVSTSILSGFPDSLLVPIYTPGWREALWELSVLPKNTTHTMTPPGLKPESSVLTTSPPHLILFCKTKTLWVSKRLSLQLFCWTRYKRKLTSFSEQQRQQDREFLHMPVVSRKQLREMLLINVSIKFYESM